MTVRRFAGLALAVALGACGGNDDEDEGSVDTRMIGPEGGQVTSADGKLTVLILPNVLDEATEVSVKLSDTPPPGTYGDAYRVRPDIDVAVPIEVTFAGEIPFDPSLSTVGAIRRADFEVGAGYWVPLERIALDANGKAVTSVDNEIALFYGLLDDGLEGSTSTTSSTDTIAGDDTMGDETTTGDDTTTGTTSTTTGGDEDSTGMPIGDSSSEGADTNIPLVDYATEVQPIWDNNCLTSDVCHTANGTPPNLTPEGSYAAIVGVSSSASLPFVTEGSADESYLMYKLDGTHNVDAPLGCGCDGVGSPMPLGQELLESDTRALVRAWIDQGALE